MTFRQFAFNNVIRSFRTYAAYFLSSAFSVMIFFTYAVFIFHPNVETGYMHELSRQGMIVAEYIIFIFSFFFVLYSMSTFIKTRKKQFGVLMIHGMTKGQLNRMIFLENMIIGTLSLGLGIAVGLIFCKLFLLLGAQALGIAEMPFYLPTKAISLTVGAFLLLFLTISFFTLFTVRTSQIIELLRGTRKPRPEPKASFLLSAFAALCLVAAYALSYTANGMTVGLLLIPVTAITIIGTYFLYSQLSVYVINRLKRNEGYHWKGTRLIWLSNLAYRMKDNARMLFLVTIISTVAITATGTLVSFHESRKAEAEFFNPYAIQYISFATDTEYEKRIQQLDQSLGNERLQYEKVDIQFLLDSVHDNRVGIMSLADYNQLAQLRSDLPHYELTEKQAILSLIYYSQVEGWGENTLPYEIAELEKSGEKLDVQALVEASVFPSGELGHILIVSEETYASLLSELETAQATVYEIEGWEETGDLTTTLFAEWTDGKGTNVKQIYSEDATITARVTMYQDMVNATSVMLYVGLFVGIIFFVSAGSFLYFRLFSDLENDKKQYQAIHRIGLTKQELKSSVTVQLLLLFLVPIALASVHASFALSALRGLLQVPIYLSAVKVIGCFLVFQLLYYALVRARYVQQLLKIAK
ncbi:ABC transporter permease [Bacillus horti]|uniref:ABC transport system permease protein n=1 Tax=Caldalkalibacillus horti TaxID=77523 RepID=A0ABT9VT87_9BACI|nr:ABC transporter permease [Bacillus horti]MDQ0164200.1 putative ABC transport system permease protein [Bacillus horti]